MQSYVFPPLAETIKYAGLHFLLGAATGLAACAILGARGKGLIPGFIFGGIGGVLPDIDHPLAGGRSFFHGTPAKVLGIATITAGAGISSKKKRAGQAVAAFGTGWTSHQAADHYKWGF
ncbi:MAG: hypothetical protein WC359_12310 [Dehalococcoidia bacterium]|jgi:hypothetical protein